MEHQPAFTNAPELNRSPMPEFGSDLSSFSPQESRSETVASPDGLSQKVFLAGERVPPGAYIEIESRREIALAVEDHLPASLNGHVAVYVRKPTTWVHIRKSRGGSV